MFKESAVWSILKDHHPSERFILFTVAEKIHEILVIYS